MKLNFTQEDYDFAREVHGLFFEKEGSDRIATEFALAHLSATLNHYRPSNVIEYGAGIGTVTYALLKHPVSIKNLVCTEQNEFCLSQLKKNIPSKMASRLTIISELIDLEKLNEKCDLMVFDGGFNSPDEARFLHEGSVCFIEGARKHTRRQINEILEPRGLTCEFENFHQGYKYFHFFDSYDYEKGLKTKKFKIRGKLKGCWIGEVTQIDDK